MYQLYQIVAFRHAVRKMSIVIGVQRDLLLINPNILVFKCRFCDKQLTHYIYKYMFIHSKYTHRTGSVLIDDAMVVQGLTSSIGYRYQ